ncbi:MAG: hypothetical protein OHK0017_08730 [Patescibacteria group bacterium]
MATLSTSKLVGLRIPTDLYQKLEAQAKKENRSLSNYIKTILAQQLEATEYLTSSPANTLRLRESVQQAKQGKKIKKTKSDLS